MLLARIFDVRMGVLVVSSALVGIGCSGAIEPTHENPPASAGAGSSAGGAQAGSSSSTTTTVVGSGGGETVGSGGAQPNAGGSAGQGGSLEPDPVIDAGSTIDPSIDARGDAPTPPPRDAARIGDASYGDGGWVGPIVEPECAGDPTDGWSEYADTFHLEYPYDLMPTDRYTFIDGIYTYWIFPTDKPHAVGNTTAPRIETHYTNFRTGTKMWTGDILVESPSNNVTIFQVHTGASGAGPVYLQVRNGNLDELDGQRVALAIYDKWFNLKVAFEAATSTATIYVNNCQKLLLRNSRPGDGNFYFKNGVYTCSTAMCRDHYKNIHLYQR